MFSTLFWCEGLFSLEIGSSQSCGSPAVASDRKRKFIARAGERSTEVKTHRDLRSYPNWLSVFRSGLEAPLHDSANRLLVQSHSEGPQDSHAGYLTIGLDDKTEGNLGLQFCFARDRDRIR